MSLILPRRAMLGGMALAPLASASASAGLAKAAPIVSMPVWAKGVPGGVPLGLVEREVPRSPTGPADDTAFLHVTRPVLLHCRPARANGAAILLVPGGSYGRVAIGRGGAELLRAFAGLGYSAFLLKYRLPGDPWSAGPDAPLQDAQRALRVIAALADKEHFDPQRIAVWGGSAGGHLAARLSNTRLPVYPPGDAIDALPLAVRATILLYPVNFMSGPYVHAPSRTALFTSAGRRRDAALAADASISAQSPPTFLAHALDDRVVPVENSLSYFTKLRAAGVAAELHVQENGGHGFGWTQPGTSQAWDWPRLAMSFIQRHGA